MDRILVLCPLYRDRRELVRLNLPYEFFFHDMLTVHENDSLKQVESHKLIKNISSQISACSITGVMSSSDDLGALLVAIVSQGNRLYGPNPTVIINQQHKLLARKMHEKVIPQATPRYCLITENSCALPYPFFVKPVRSNFSRGSKIVRSEAELVSSLIAAKNISPLQSWYSLAQHYCPEITDGIMAESVCTGLQCTVEGFVAQGVLSIIGIVDSVMFPGTISFKQFNYPSQLPPEIQQRLKEIVTTLIQGIGLDNSFFNVECIYNPDTDELHVIEVNPRIASQFADLYEKVNGVNSYEQLVAIALGKKPTMGTGGNYSCASSCVLRIFEDKRIERMPSLEQIESIHAQFPDARIELFGKPGQLLSHLMQDGASYRYGLINIGGTSFDDIEHKANEIKQLLDITLSPA